MATAISCPNCDCKMSVRSELAGQRVTCPHCKSPFLAPAADGAAGGAAAFPAGGSSPAGTDFFSDLSSTTTRPSASRPNGKAAGSSRGKAAGSSRGKSAGSSRGKTAGGNRAAAKKLPIEWIIGGGVGAGLLLIILVLVMVMGGPSKGKHNSKNGKQTVVKFGLSESQRRKLFYDLYEAVDRCGVNDNCRQEWRNLEKRYGVDREAVAKILDEGMGGSGGGLSDWRLPDFPEGTPAARANRKQWIRERGLDGSTDPLLRD